MDIPLEAPLHGLVRYDTFYNEISLRLTDPNLRDRFGNTLLQAAARSRNYNDRIVQLLLERGADVNAATPFGHTALHFAVSARKRFVFADLLEAGASVNAKDCLGRTALHFAIGERWSNPPSPVLCIQTDMWIVETLLSHPEISINPADHAGDTPLMWAVREQNWRAVHVLLKFGANPNISCAGNRTPLHEVLSVENVDEDTTFSLLTMGAGIYCADYSGKTPIDILIQKAQDDRSFLFSACCLSLIAFHYQIDETLRAKLQPNPCLSDYLDACNKEVGLMKRLVIYGKFTLHDFVLDCFQERVADPVRDIFTKVVEVLLSGCVTMYFQVVLFRFSRSDLLNVLERTDTDNSYHNFIPPDASNLIIYRTISSVYDASVILRRRLLRMKSYVQKFI